MASSNQLLTRTIQFLDLKYVHYPAQKVRLIARLNYRELIHIFQNLLETDIKTEQHSDSVVSGKGVTLYFSSS